MEFDKILDFDESEKEFESFFRLVQTQVVPQYHWYTRNAFPARLFFRLSGTLVIVFSVTIPAIAAVPAESFPDKDMVISVMALGIAILSGLNAFYKWGEKWQSFVRAALGIKHLIAVWQMELQDARFIEDGEQRMKIANDATKKLIEETGTIVSQETEQYFSKVKWPKKAGELK